MRRKVACVPDMFLSSEIKSSIALAFSSKKNLLCIGLDFSTTI